MYCKTTTKKILNLSGSLGNAFFGYNWNGPWSHFGPLTFLVSKKVGPRDIWSPRKLVPNPKKFDPQEIWVPKNLNPKNVGPCMKMP